MVTLIPLHSTPLSHAAALPRASVLAPKWPNRGGRHHQVYIPPRRCPTTLCLSSLDLVKYRASPTSNMAAQLRRNRHALYNLADMASAPTNERAGQGQRDNNSSRQPSRPAVENEDEDSEASAANEAPSDESSSCGDSTPSEGLPALNDQTPYYHGRYYPGNFRRRQSLSGRSVSGNHSSQSRNPNAWSTPPGSSQQSVRVQRTSSQKSISPMQLSAVPSQDSLRASTTAQGGPPQGSSSNTVRPPQTSNGGRIQASASSRGGLQGGSRGSGCMGR